MSLLTMGENWHNNHHAYPYSAKLGLKKNQWDPGWWVLILLKNIGLVDNLKLPDKNEIREDISHIE
jgi:fatty-acid desaturase